MSFALTSIVTVLVLASGECATRRFDTPPVYEYDSRSSAGHIPLEAMNPMNQPKSSSYSIVDTSRGSHSAITASRPDGRYPVNRFVGQRRKKKRPPRPEFRHERVPHRRKPSKPLSIPFSDHTSANIVDEPSRGDFRTDYNRGGRHFDKEDGGKFVEEHKIREGTRAHRGGKKEKSYDEMDEKNRDSEEHRTSTAEKQDLKNQHSLDQKHRGRAYEGREGEKGLSLKKNSGHKKSYRRSGYRRVHNKEEYKLDEEFFERSHRGKDRREHLKEQEKHAKEKADAVKKTSHDSAQREGHSEKKAVEEKGATQTDKSGHKKEVQDERHEDERSKYDDKKDTKEDSEHRQVKDDKSKGSFFDDFF